MSRYSLRPEERALLVKLVAANGKRVCLNMREQFTAQFLRRHGLVGTTPWGAPEPTTAGRKALETEE